MKVKYKAYASVREEDCGYRRLAELIKDTHEEAEKAADTFRKKYKGACVGTHKYYIILRREWKDMQYTGKSSKCGKEVRTWMYNDGTGISLLYEGTHFDIV